MTDCLTVREHDHDPAELAMSKRVAEALVKHYPNHRWGVRVTQGVIYVKNLTLDGRMGFVVHLTKVFSATDLDKKLLLAGGEILERFAMSRARLSAEEIENRVLALPTNFAGHVGFQQ